MTDQDKLALGEKRAKELCLQPVHMPSGSTYYHEATIFKLLGEGVEAGIVKACTVNGKQHWRTADLNDRDGETHTALLIGIRPLVQESEERKLLREFVAWWKSADYPPDFLDRARKLLERP